MTLDCVIVGDVRDVLPTLPDRTFACCVTSPPYWGLRDYGVAGQLGLERTPEEYVARMVAVFREVRRTLRDDGTLWLNLGDSYATGAGKVGDCPGGGDQGERWKGRAQVPQTKNPKANLPLGPTTQPNRTPIDGLKPKDLVGIPWRMAFALQADGWYLRSDIIWHKPNPMPESITDRPTKAHEYLFLLAKSERYYYDQAAIREPDSGQDHPRSVLDGEPSLEPSGGLMAEHRGLRTTEGRNGKGRNRRTVWTIPTKPYADAHFATFPPALVEPCILAGSRPGDVVLDTFIGSGTVGQVAQQLGRHWVGVELNPRYEAMARRRTAQKGLHQAEVREGER